MHFPSLARRAAGAALVLSLCACSGSSNDSDNSREIQLSTESLTFTATAPDAATPASQVITATFGSNVANVSVMHTGLAIASVTTTVNGTSAQLTVVPSAPNTVGAGQFTSTLAVTAYFCADATCSRLESGGSRTVTAKYQISPVVNHVGPNVAVAGVAAGAVIRGVGFSGYAIQGVRFGDVAATASTVISDSEIRATYPALAAGTYPIGLDIPTHPDAITSTATLVAVDPVTYAAQALAWPAAVSAVRAVQYDAQRAALLVATDAGGGSLLRYPYVNSAWEAPTSVAVTDLQDAALSADGTQLLAVSRTSLTPVDPTTLAPGTPVNAPTLPANSYLKNLAVINTNQALLTTGIAESTSTPLYAYTVRTGVMTQLSSSLNNATPGVSANGAQIGLVQGHASLTTAPAFYTFDATTGSIGARNIAINQNAIAPVLDRDATRLVLNGINVYDAAFALLGKLPETTLAVALRPDGKRAYTYDSAAGALLRFDISATKNGEAFTALGATVPLSAAPGAGVKMTISPDGNTLFLAGTTQLVIEPTPLDP